VEGFKTQLQIFSEDRRSQRLWFFSVFSISICWAFGTLEEVKDWFPATVTDYGYLTQYSDGYLPMFGWLFTASIPSAQDILVTIASSLELDLVECPRNIY